LERKINIAPINNVGIPKTKRWKLTTQAMKLMAIKVSPI
jgi:hypothetical protein